VPDANAACLRPQEFVPLAPLTSIGLGGPARFFATAASVEGLRASLTWARDRDAPLFLLGGGSNVVFPDEGFPGLVLKVGLRGRTFQSDGAGHVLAVAAAGEPWDDFVSECVRRGLGGLECLSGIPGLVGATPLQNVGAYGQEVGEAIVGVRALDRGTQEEVEFAGAECGFAYRSSRFRGPDQGRYAITWVVFRLPAAARPTVRYAELQQELERRQLQDLPAGRVGLGAVRDAVLALRRRKAMLVDPADPDARSVGSFFKNPLLSPAEFRQVDARWRRDGGTGDIPWFKAAEPGGAPARKVPAAWLIEQAGFRKGYRRGGVGVSAKHALALINAGGTARELLALAEEIRATVRRRFGIELDLEPVLAG
jgi:UDP-N-acetylmuramate dehydrogenase